MFRRPVLRQFPLLLPTLGLLGATHAGVPTRPAMWVSTSSSTPERLGPERLVADAPIWGAKRGFKGYAFLPVTLHGTAATVVIDLQDEGDLTLSSAALARLGVPLPDTTTVLDALIIGAHADVQHRVPLRLIPDPDWSVEGPPQLPPVVGSVGSHFLTTHYDVLYDFPARRVRLYAVPAAALAHPVIPSRAWLPPGVKTSDCGRMIAVPPGAGTFTGMAMQLDGHPVTGVLEMGPYQEKMNQTAVDALGLPVQSPRVEPIPDGTLPPGYSHNGYPITQQVKDVHLTVGSHTFWTGPVQIFPVLDVESVLPPKTPVMLLNLSTIRTVVLFNAVSSGQVCFSTPPTASRPSALATERTAVPATAGRDTAVVWHELRSNMGELHGQLPQLIKARIDSARAQGRTLFLEVGATWCGPCLQLDASLKTPDMIDAFAGTSIVHLDANEWDLEKDMAPMGIKGGVMPLLIAINTTGKVVAQLNGVIKAVTLKHFVNAHRWPNA